MFIHYYPPHLLKQSKIWLVLVVLWVINGSSFLAIKVSIDTIPPLLSAGIRFSLSGAALFIVYLLRNRATHKHGEYIGVQQWKDTLVLGVSLFVGGQGLLVWGTQYLSSGITGLLNSTIPLWVALISMLVFRKHLTKKMITGLLAGFGGLMLLIAPSLGNGTLSPVGTAALITSSIAWAVGSLYSTKAHLPISILASSGMLLLVGGLMLLVSSFVLGEFDAVRLSQISTGSTIALLYLIIVTSMIGFTDFYWLVRITTAALANTFAYVSPVIAVFLGWAILKEPITSLTLVAMSVILIGVALMVTTPSKSKSKSKPILKN